MDLELLSFNLDEHFESVSDYVAFYRICHLRSASLSISLSEKLPVHKSLRETQDLKWKKDEDKLPQRMVDQTAEGKSIP